LTYVIAVYDVDESRVGKINRTLKSYLIWIQNSVFEGNLSESLYEEMINKIIKILSPGDSFIVYILKSDSAFQRYIYGENRNNNLI